MFRRFSDVLSKPRGSSEAVLVQKVPGSFVFDASNIEIPHFQGYCFQGDDLIIGRDGYNEFSANGNNIHAGEDGCYVVVSGDASSIRIGTDFNGYHPLFYYSGSDYWAVSNSFYELYNHLKTRVPLTLREHNLRAWGSSLAFTQQLNSFRTCINEIRLVPSFCELHIQNGAITLVPVVNDRKKSYEDALHCYLSTWVNRLGGILNSHYFRPSVDLTGGIDSRTVLSLITSALNGADLGKMTRKGRVNLRSQKEKQEDFRIASFISSELGLTLNRSVRGFMSQKLSAERAFETWQVTNLGRYSPIIFPTLAFDARRVRLPGTGGGCHRPFFEKSGRGDNLADYIHSYRKYFQSNQLLENWLEDIESTMEFVRENSYKGKRDLVLHFRQFRDRFHGSKLPLSEMQLSVLGSRLLFDCSDLAEDASFENNQILFDIQYNTNHRLPGMPFDTNNKSPQKFTLRNITWVDEIECNAGRVYGGGEAAEVPGEPNDFVSKPVDILLDRALSAANNKVVREFLGGEYCNKAIGDISTLKSKQTINNNLHAKGAFAHNLLLTKEVLT